MNFLCRLNGLKATLSIPATPSAAQAAPTLGAAKSRLRTTVSASVLPKAPSRIATESGSGANTPMGFPGGRRASAAQHAAALATSAAANSLTLLLHNLSISGIRNADNRKSQRQSLAEG